MREPSTKPDRPAAGTSKPKTPPPSRPSQSSLGRGASPLASRRAATILEVLAGLRTAPQAAAALGISVNHYYLLERKALQGLVAACEPQPKGPGGPSAEKKLASLQRELDRSRRECLRQAALVRATQRAVGLPAAAPAKPRNANPGAKPGSSGAKRKRRRRPAAVRALRAAETLRKNSSGPDKAEVVEPSLPGGSVSDGAAAAPSRKVIKESSDGAIGKETFGGRSC